MKLTISMIVAVVAALLAAAAADTEECYNQQSFRSIVHGSGRNTGSLTFSFEHFRGLLGGLNNGNDAGPLPSGHRQINWDAGIVPFDFPRKFFADTVDRGMSVFSKKNKFAVSGPAPDNVSDRRFSTINHTESKTFKAFSKKRLFTPLRETVFWTKFSVPGTNKRALVQGFGAVFVGVDLPKTTRMVAYDKNDCILAEEYVDAYAGGMSFLGFYFKRPIIARVAFYLGNQPIDYPYCGTSCGEDVVVMDDFLYGEPQAF
mmetsp:Transcript_14532/g.58956  ORF Transcript_14532/g.58956 Transcript_14532/m.58956 type:complete len:259 (-) Transcript_14532:152-928(-)